MAITTPEQLELRTCNRCNTPKSLDDFPVVNGQYLRFCQTCHLAARRARYARMKDQGTSSSTQRQKRTELRRRLGHDLYEQTPDPQPARLLVDCLIDSRRLGLTFEEAWSDDVEFVLERFTLHAREQWADAFAATRPAYEAAWSNTPGPGMRLSVALLDGFDSERADAHYLG